MTRRPWLALTCAALLLCAAPAPLFAEEDEKEAEESEFTTTWIGLRAGGYYRPAFNMNAQVSGRSRSVFGQVATLIGNEFDVGRDLGVTENVHTEGYIDFAGEAALELEPFVDTRWVSVHGWVVTPFEYQGQRTLTRTINFAGTSFSTNVNVESKFKQFMFGTDVLLNIFNNRFFRISPLIALRALGIDWEIKTSSLGQVIKGDTSDIKSPLQLGDYQVLPYPELGASVAVGYRDYIEVSLIAAGSYVDYYGVEGGTIRLEAAVTAYPIPWVGIQLGARYLSYDFASQANSSKNGSFDFELEFTGFTFALIVRL
ncbi:MAG: hypothetical protein AB7N76_36945 [Planctomycetota bacterium]